MRTLLIDGDVLAYQQSQFNEIAVEDPPDYWYWYCDFTKVKESIKWQINSFMKRLEADKFILCLTDTTNFRKEVLSSYKGNRSNFKKPLVLKPTREYLIDHYGALIWPSLEGDDIMSILATEPHEDERIIVSIDKDMQSVNAQYYNPNRDIVVTINEQEADYYHLYQTLVGDVTDGYKGLDGFGAVSAKKLLDTEGATWSTVVKAYNKKGYTEEYALAQARVAKILRHEDWNRETKTPILWNTKEKNNP